MKIKKEQEDLIINLGALEYGTKKISDILGIDEDTIFNELKDKGSELYRLLQKGKSMAEYVIDLRLFEMAKTGDIKALNELDRRKRKRKM